MAFRPVAFLAAALFCGCRNSSLPPLVDAAPAGTIAMAGIDLTALRASPVYPKLPGVVTALAEPLRDASAMLLAWNGKDLLLLARGNFTQPPPGYTVIAPGIAAAGAPERIASAQAQLRSGRRSDLKLITLNNAIWAVVQGDGHLPLTGDLENANNLLRDAGYTTLSAELHGTIDVALTAHCPTPENARRFEESLRAVVTLGTAASVRDAPMLALLQSIHIDRDDRVVHATAIAPPEAFGKLMAPK